MRVIKEYLLDDKSLAPQSIYLPIGTDVVSIQETGIGLMLLVITTPDEYTARLPEMRKFKICSSDENIFADTLKYIGSFKNSLGTRHVVEIIEGD